MNETTTGIPVTFTPAGSTTSTTINLSPLISYRFVVALEEQLESAELELAARPSMAVAQKLTREMDLPRRIGVETDAGYYELNTDDLPVVGLEYQIGWLLGWQEGCTNGY